MVTILICKLTSEVTTYLGRSALNRWASGVSFQSIRVLANADVSPENSLRGAMEDGESWKGSQMSREKGSKMLLSWSSKKLGMIDIFGLAFNGIADVESMKLAADGAFKKD
ncbi:hypothetical protein HHK36_032701 [Tetracentron sinense]|uniref:Uncharacterized protein n=1 Tax=Tetracentron sinense TaxID=13715 RepID=A0A835D066_TETSI|nr:hypothetical protein HHK36_032701 [Tetracentron sinense]